MKIFKPKGRIYPDKNRTAYPGAEHLGKTVISTAGRDRGTYYIITGVVDAAYVLAANGTVRKIQEPKKKNLRHLSFTGESVPPQFVTLTGVTLTDGQLAEILEKYNAADPGAGAKPDV